MEGWNTIDEGGCVLFREYAFTKGAYATTLVFRGADGLVVVSPAAHLDARAYDALAEHGELRALIASNADHYLGQKEWRARFPDAESYAPPGALPSLAKKLPGVPFRSLAELELPHHVRWEDAPGFKTGETILSVDTERGPVWFTGDVLTNIQRMPGPPLRWLFTLTGSAPGFRLFRLATWAFMRDKRAVREWMLARLDEHPPAIVVPAHGPAYDEADVVERARQELRRL